MAGHARPGAQPLRLGLLMLLTALALPVRAGVFDDDEARARIEQLRADMRTELDAMAVRIDRATKNQIDFANQAEAVKADLAHLRGQMEVLANEVETTQKRQRDFYVDLDSRLRKLEPTATPAAADARPDSTPKVDPAQETRDYEAALNAFKAAKYKDAAAAFVAFIKAYPNSGLLPNAHYWYGSSQYRLGEFARAAETFGKVATTWPNDPKAPDALLAQGSALAEAGDAKGSRKVFETLVAQYPAAPAAQTAKLRLKKK
jgi:tol-pal system protein YbgF